MNLPLIAPFRALRPQPQFAANVCAPPYDVLSTEEARVLAAGNEYSFLHVSKAEIDFPPDTDPYAPQVYERAAANLATLIEQGILQRDGQAMYYAYRLTMPWPEGEHVQTGFAAAALVAAYDAQRIRRHELTRPDKEDDRVRQIDAVGAQTGPVLLAYPDCPPADALLDQATASVPAIQVTARDGIRHELWPISDPTVLTGLTLAIEALPALYIADGHHRSAAASRIAAQRHKEGIEQASDRFLAVLFPQAQMRILDYNRVVSDLNGLSEAEFLEQLNDCWDVLPASGPVKPARVGEVGLYLPGRWFRLHIRPQFVPADPVGALDVQLLTDRLLTPILGIGDLRRDQRIDFVGGMRGLSELEKRVDHGGMAAAFAMFPTSMPALMQVADAGLIMPPKSTWFEPKLADGLVSHVLD